MEAELYLAQTAPAFAQFQFCDRGHIHVLVNWVSRHPVMPFDDPSEMQINRETGEIARPAYDVTFSLN